MRLRPLPWRSPPGSVPPPLPLSVGAGPLGESVAVVGEAHAGFWRLWSQRGQLPPWPITHSEKAQQLRRCRATRKDGSPCRGWACWDDPRQLLRSHGGNAQGRRAGSRSGLRQGGKPLQDRPRAVTCRCKAYAWPHRPGGGLCQWPEPPRSPIRNLRRHACRVEASGRRHRRRPENGSACRGAVGRIPFLAGWGVRDGTAVASQASGTGCQRTDTYLPHDHPGQCRSPQHMARWH